MSATPAPQPSAPKVADAVARTLKAYGARFAFGIPGNDVLETIRACEEQCIEFVLAKAEPSACFMADAVYQLTGKPAVLIPALGPGISNAMSGIAGALMERTAMMILCGEMATRQAGVYNHQVFDHVDLAKPVTKYADQLNPHRAAQQVAKALDIALAYPAGPVMLNGPADFIRSDSTETETRQPPRQLPAALTADGVAQLQKRLAAARRPLALLGRGVLHEGVPAALKAFLESWHEPFFASYKAKGVVSDHHPLCVGAVGLSPVIDGENLKLLREADLLLLIGFDPIELRDAWLDAWAESLPVVTIDWAAQTHRIYPVGEQAVGDVPTLLRQLTADTAAAARWPAERLKEFNAGVAHLVRPRMPAKGISPAALFQTISDQATDDWIMTVDVGAHRILANHVIKCRTPGQLLQSNGLGCMGYAVPAAIGAQLVHPDRPVVAMLGDGCMLMTQGELAVAAERDLPIVVVVLNDAALALIKLKQDKMKMSRRAVDFRSPRFDKIAEGFGARGVRVETIADFDRALREAVASRRMTVIDALVDPSEYWEEM
ncbi:MAG TPA: thiamine pyrophosphate-binding protein [Pelomicrobium sp.]|nr:thiamine pyrophosphate-binding protein [Pelomicrobium sp.]